MIRTRRLRAGARGRRALVSCALGLALACGDSDEERVALTPSAWPVGDLVDVAVPASEQAIVLSADGRIHTTRDGGSSWRIAHLPAVGPLRGVSMAGPRIGWAFGAGVILRTDDGGERWREQRLPGPVAKFDLVALAVIDAERALGVGGAGLRLRTTDGGAVWQDLSLAPLVPGESAPGFVDVSCASDRSGRCWTVDREIRFSADAGASWRILLLEDAIAMSPIEFGFGRVEVSESAVLEMRTVVAGRPRTAKIRWRVDAGVSPREVDRIGDERDPSALFALIEARVEEVRSMLEALGVSAGRIETVAAPPWDYEDLIDDDPDFLARYRMSRLEVGARARIHAREHVLITALAVDAAGFGIAVGRSGRGLRADRAELRFRPIALAVPHDLLDVAAARERVVAVGLQGGLFTSSDRGGTWHSVEAEGAGVSFETLRSISFGPEGLFGFVVGARGRLLRSRDGGASWQVLAPPAQEDQLPVR